MNIARMNFSHGDYADHQVIYQRLRPRPECPAGNFAVLADLQGPKIRLGRFADGPHEWSTGENVIITVDDITGTRDRVSTTYKGLAQDARPGDRLLIDDGKVGLVVTGVTGNDVHLPGHRRRPGVQQQGISLPGMNVSVPAMSDKDIADLKFALSLGVDIVALSFVRSPDDVNLVHQVMDDVGAPRIPVIAKIEKPEAVENLEAIVLAFDGIMVARGDLGVELPLEQVPLVQKAGRATRPGERPPGHRRHPDARLHDRALPADPRRGLRRRQRRPRRRRRGHALRRNLRRQIPHRYRPHHGRSSKPSKPNPCGRHP